MGKWGKWGSGGSGEVGEFQLKPHHPPQRARSDHPNTPTP
ncbi:hypothetical protein VL20_517 [Microcystis panniformis FACHB-1757]|uniref:Uncharacterized protein n=1 Tax=Microcystis panniformis FACHB-1757 TaxID=1638788 RepID=A0A0K1RVB1_9CHRO|nr:hypothetical protein VL20_517 [Microcystis panniformis FACHB-1757]